MRKVYGVTLVILLLSISACANETHEKDMVGKWMYIGSLNQSSDVECPDLFHIQDNGTYLNLNDCYAPDATFPVTEKGRWAYYPDRKELILSDRVFEVNYYFAGPGKVLVINVQSVSENILDLSIKGKRGEKFKRIE